MRDSSSSLVRRRRKIERTETQTVTTLIIDTPLTTSIIPPATVHLSPLDLLLLEPHLERRYK